MSGQYDFVPVAVFGCLSTERIRHSSAISVDSAGNAHELKPGEAFRGFTTEAHDPSRDETRLSVVVRFEGVETLPVSGFTGTEFGAPVFAQSAHEFTMIPGRYTASRIGHIVGKGEFGKALVKFESAKL